jgi:DNA-binding NtrC family response regulator
VAATNIEPMEAVKQNKLREDLYYRLNVFAVHLPPLRERLDDLPLLVHAFITQFAKEQQKTVIDVDEAAMDALRAHTWPGNVRELRNVIERATIITRGQTIGVGDLAGLKTAREVQASGVQGSGFGVQGAVQGSGVQGSGVQGSEVQGSGVQGSGLYPGLTVDEAERQLIQITLTHTGGNKTKAAAMLGISLKTLHNKLTREAQKAGE